MRHFMLNFSYVVIKKNRHLWIINDLILFLIRFIGGNWRRVASRGLAHHRLRGVFILRTLSLRASHVDEQGQRARLQEAIRPVRFLQITSHRRPHFFQLLASGSTGARRNAQPSLPTGQCRIEHCRTVWGSTL